MQREAEDMAGLLLCVTRIIYRKIWKKGNPETRILFANFVENTHLNVLRYARQYNLLLYLVYITFSYTFLSGTKFFSHLKRPTPLEAT
jgi:hypothetical protein